MVRVPLTPQQIEAGRRLGDFLRQGRGERDQESVARRAGISAETLRKIEAGRIASPGFGTVVAICQALDMPIVKAVDAWQGESRRPMAV